MNKEEIYDSKIAPLMTRIIEICKEHKIGMLASYAIPIPSDEGLECTTLLSDETGEPPELLRECAVHIRRSGRPTPLMITTQHSDGSKTLTAVLGANRERV